MPDTPDLEKLNALDMRIKAAQAVDAPRQKHENKYQKASAAWRMVLELVVGMIMGLGIGYGLDSLFGTLPIFLILFSLLGFAAGIRTMMRTAEEIQNK
ncbi:MAG: AtpZ/AtpI family protein [Paracoccaceae bacterium]